MNSTTTMAQTPALDAMLQRGSTETCEAKPQQAVREIRLSHIARSEP